MLIGQAIASVLYEAAFQAIITFKDRNYFKEQYFSQTLNTSEFFNCGATVEFLESAELREEAIVEELAGGAIFNDLAPGMKT